MSKKFNMLHSHSGLEREMKFPKHFVLVDAQFKNMFIECNIKPITYGGRTYYQVPTLAFAKKGGFFKNFME